MSYRIRYEVRSKGRWYWGIGLFGVIGLGAVWSRVAAGEGLYDALARYVGGMILGPH